MGRDRATYRFLQDTRYGRKVLFEGTDREAVADRITEYVAFRLIEREKALSHEEGEAESAPRTGAAASASAKRPRFGWRGLLLFLAGALVGAASILALAFVLAE